MKVHHWLLAGPILTVNTLARSGRGFKATLSISSIPDDTLKSIDDLGMWIEANIGTEETSYRFEKSWIDGAWEPASSSVDDLLVRYEFDPDICASGYTATLNLRGLSPSWSTMEQAVRNKASMIASLPSVSGLLIVNQTSGEQLLSQVESKWQNGNGTDNTVCLEHRVTDNKYTARESFKLTAEGPNTMQDAIQPSLTLMKGKFPMSNDSVLLVTNYQLSVSLIDL